jgi:tRNA A-37 threonylcarbamoyl transferase component Bud32
MGRVWRAADDMLDRQVAIKEMRIDGLDPEDTRTRRQRTLREARATARIDHPNVVRIHDVVDEGERLWIVMELVDGRSLERILGEGGPLDVRETARLGLELLAALGQVHAGGVLHRDIKPANVLVEHAGRHRVVLTDFGIAAIQDAEALTMAGMLVGSPDYMAPERVSGRPQGPPSDLWSLGATLCAALGGHSPFSRATTYATLHAVLYEEPDIPPGAGELGEIVAALLDKEPGARPELDEVAQVLGRVAAVGTGEALAEVGGVAQSAGADTSSSGTGAGGAGAAGVDEAAHEAVEAGAGESERGAGGLEGHRTGAGADVTWQEAPAEPDAGEPHGLHGPDAGAPGAPSRRTPPPDPHRDPDPDLPGRPGTAPEPAPADDAGGVRRTPTLRNPPAPEKTTPPTTQRPAGPEPPPALVVVENASSEAPSESTPELPSEGAPPGPGLWASGVQVERAEPTSSATGTEPEPEAEPEAEAETEPEPEEGRPVHPSPTRWSRRRTGIVAAMGVGVAVAGAVAALVIPAVGGSPDGGSPDGKGTSRTAPSAVTSGPTGDLDQDRDRDSDRDPDRDSSAPPPTVAGTSRPPSIPAGAEREAGLYAWIPPQGWQRVAQSGAEVHYTSPDRRQEILANASPAQGDLLRQWRDKEEQDTRKGLDYRRSRLEETTFRGAPAVVWEYAVTARGRRSAPSASC